MLTLDHSEILILLLSMGLLLGCARLLAEMCLRIGLPGILGELCAGLALGPTILGRFAPEVQEQLFASGTEPALALQGFSTIAIVLFLFVAGLEVDLGSMRRQGRVALGVAASATLVPFIIALAPAWAAPSFFDAPPEVAAHIFILFFATAMSISSVPVIAKTLMDFGVYRSDFGMLVMASAFFNDLAGWVLFAILLGMMGQGAGGEGHSIWATVGLTLLMVGAAIGPVRWLLDWFLPWMQTRLSWPAGVLGFMFAAVFCAAALAEWVGIHGIFGAFLFGIAIGDSRHLRRQTRHMIEQFVSTIFAPLFFAAIGLQVDFAANFDVALCLVVLVIATAGKLLGGVPVAVFAGMPRREALGVGFALNARGAMEIILGLLALQAGVITERLFVALVFTAIATSLLSAPAIAVLLRHLIHGKKRRRFTDFMPAGGFIGELKAVNINGAIRELANVAAPAAKLTPAAVASAVLAREDVMSTDLGNGIAVPHARFATISTPVVCVGISSIGIESDAAGAITTRVVMLLLTPSADYEAQLELLADIARTFEKPGLFQQALQARSQTQFLALIRTERGEGHAEEHGV